MSADYQLNLLAFPGAYAVPLETTPLITNVVFRPLARRLGSTPGVLVDQVHFGSFRLAWDVGLFSFISCFGTDVNDSMTEIRIYGLYRHGIRIYRSYRNLMLTRCSSGPRDLVVH